MDENPYDPRVLSRRHYRENLWLRDILESVAHELERMAANGQGPDRNPAWPSSEGAAAATSGRAGWVDGRAMSTPAPMTSMRIGVGAFIVSGGRVLLGLRAHDRDFYPGVWDVFGGHVEAGESKDGALKREFAEELGIEPTQFDWIGSFDEPNAEQYGPGHYDFYVVRAWSGDPGNVSAEHDEIRWFSLDELQDVHLASQEYAKYLRAILSERR